MSGFYISKIIAFRNGHSESSIQLKDGLNIIYGPSNTGKSLLLKYIDFIFASEETPESTIDVDKIIIEIRSREKGSAELSRTFNEKKIYINNSSIENIQNGEYKLKGEDSINDIFLRLIGIDSVLKIFAKQDYTKQNNITWRSIKDFFFTSETDIITEKTYFFTGNFTNPTYLLGCLQYLITGTERKTPKGSEDPQEKQIKKSAVKAYITQKITELEKQRTNLSSKLQELSGPDVEQIIKEKSNLLLKETEELGNILDNNLNIEEQRNQYLSEINELELLLERLYELDSQYLSDIERLKFIIDGERIRKTFSQNTKCPYCESQIQPKQHKTYIITETKELEKLQINLKELQETIKSNEEDKKELIRQTVGLTDTYNENTQKASEIQKRIQAISDSITEYDKVSKLQLQIEIIDANKEQLEEELKNIDTTISPKASPFDIKAEFEENLFQKIENMMDEIIRKTDFEDYNSIKIDRKSLDLLINNKPKKNQGKGYRAFLNALYAHALTKFLAQDAKYSPGFLILDSPLLSLKEKNESSSTSMKTELMKALMDNSIERQTIIVENEIPKINYEQANMIEFTQDRNNGRYGFIID